MKKKLLIATHNPAKFERYKMLVFKKDVEPLSLKEMGITFKVEESEPTALMNAIKKARKYAEASHLPTLAIDEELFIDVLAPEKQPGVNVRRIIGHEATDEELLQAILGLLKDLPLKRRGCIWNFAMALAIPKGKISTREVKLQEFFGLEPKRPLRPGYPLSSLLYNLRKGKYQVEYTPREELERLSEVKKAVEELLKENLFIW